MLVAFRLRKFLRIVHLRITSGNRQGCPLRIAAHFADKNDLSHVVRIMRQLAVNGFHHGVAHVADVDRALQIGVGERLQRIEQAFPARIPLGHHFRAGGGIVFEFRVPVSGFLFAVGGEEIRPARQHVSPQVFDNHSDAVAFRVVLPEQLVVGKLREGLFAEVFVVEELFLDGGEVG